MSRAPVAEAPGFQNGEETAVEETPGRQMECGGRVTQTNSDNWCLNMLKQPIPGMLYSQWGFRMF